MILSSFITIYGILKMNFVTVIRIKQTGEPNSIQINKANFCCSRFGAEQGAKRDAG